MKKYSTGRTRGDLGEFCFYLLAAASFAGFAMCACPTWPVIFGILSLSVIVGVVFCYVWSHTSISNDEDEEDEESRGADEIFTSENLRPEPKREIE